MGGAKLKTKYDTAEVHRKDKNVSAKKEGSAVRKRATKKKAKKFDLPPIERQDTRHELFAKVKSESYRKAVRPASARKVLKSAQRVIDQASDNALRRSLQAGPQQQHNNLFLTNCDTWTKVHCHNHRGPNHRPRSVRSH